MAVSFDFAGVHETNFTDRNFAWIGSYFKDLWIVGNGGAARVKWRVKEVRESDVYGIW